MLPDCDGGLVQTVLRGDDVEGVDAEDVEPASDLVDEVPTAADRHRHDGAGKLYGLHGLDLRHFLVEQDKRKDVARGQRRDRLQRQLRRAQSASQLRCDDDIVQIEGTQDVDEPFMPRLIAEADFPLRQLEGFSKEGELALSEAQIAAGKQVEVHAMQMKIASPKRVEPSCIEMDRIGRLEIDVEMEGEDRRMLRQ